MNVIKINHKTYLDFFYKKKQIGFCDECHQHPSQKLPSFFLKKKTGLVL